MSSHSLVYAAIEIASLMVAQWTLNLAAVINWRSFAKRQSLRAMTLVIWISSTLTFAVLLYKTIFAKY